MKPIKIMIVDDALIVRGLLRRMLEGVSDFEVVASCADGESAIHSYLALKPDVVLMDVEMPRLDGFEALKQIRALDKDARIIMCSSLTLDGAEMTQKVLAAGAMDYLSKPSTKTVDSSAAFQQQLVQKIRAYAKNAKTCIVEAPPLRKAAPKVSRQFPSIIAIGSSTGGPKALSLLLSLIKRPLSCPVVITQHIPLGFSRQLADNLGRTTGHDVCEAQSDMPLESGRFYVAPGGSHLTVAGESAPVIRLSDAPAINFCRPSVDVMLRSVLDVYETDILTLILTGMGEDGKAGCAALVAKSSTNRVLVQNEESSVVWGMPGAVAKAGLAHEVLTIEKLADAVNHAMQQRKVVT